MIVSYGVDVRRPVDNLRGIAARAGNARPPFARIQPLLQEDIAENFDSQGGEFGKPWPPLRPGTLANKARKGQPSTPMVATGESKAALTGGAGAYRAITRSSAFAGAGKDLFWLRFAHFGTPHQAARPLVGITEPTVAISLAMIENWILDGAM